MSQVLDFRKFLQVVSRNRRIVGIAAAIGLVVGAAFALLRPPMPVAKSLVVLPSSNALSYVQTQALIAASDPVLARASKQLDPPLTTAVLRGRVQAKGLTSDVLAISAQGENAGQAEDTANAVARSYVAYIRAPSAPGGRVLGEVLEPATSAAGTSLPVRIIIDMVLGALVGALIGAITVFARSRNDRRLRDRDAIADAIGIPVLASIPAGHPADPASWVKLLDGYEPDAVHAWSLRKALRHLGLTDVRGGSAGGVSVAVLSLSTDPGALALGPQLAVFAASLGIPTALTVGPEQDSGITATLTAACAGRSSSASQPGNLLSTVADDGSSDVPPGVLLTVVVVVVDAQNPQLAGVMRTTAAVVGVSAGAATAEQLARIAVCAANDNRDIGGIIVADPDPADRTTGRLPQVIRPVPQLRPTRLTGRTTGTRR